MLQNSPITIRKHLLQHCWPDSCAVRRFKSRARENTALHRISHSHLKLTAAASIPTGVLCQRLSWIPPPAPALITPSPLPAQAIKSKNCQSYLSNGSMRVDNKIPKMRRGPMKINQLISQPINQSISQSVSQTKTTTVALALPKTLTTSNKRLSTRKSTVVHRTKHTANK